MLTPATATVGPCGRGRFIRARTDRATIARLALLSITLVGLSRTGAADARDRAKAVTVEARDLVTDAPAPNVRLELRLRGGKTLEETTDASGAARFLLPDAGKVRHFVITASREGFVPQVIPWDYKVTSPTPPEHLVFQLEKGRIISGLVVDQDGNPVTDATVVVAVVKRYPKSNQRAYFRFEATKADGNGRWSFANVPEAPDEVEVGAYHHLFLSDPSAYEMEKVTSLSALRDGSAVVRLQRGTRVEGTVVGPDGRPVSGAEVS